SVQNLAKGLSFWLTQKGIVNTHKVLLSHSMGGLIAWSYLNELGGDITTKQLITLATPFHGTPAANEAARKALANSISSNPVSVLACYLYADIGFWGLDSADSPGKPNRSDLLYDNYDCTLPVYPGL